MTFCLIVTDEIPPTDRAHFIGPLGPLVCSFRHNGRKYGITLYATSIEQLLSDNVDLEGLRIEGILVSSSPG